MVLDAIENLPLSLPLCSGFGKALEFLSRRDLAGLAEGKYEIDGQRIFAIVTKTTGRKKENVRLEAHGQYIDIQAVLAGADYMGWKSVSRCRKPVGDYSKERDVRFFLDEPDIWLLVRYGLLAIFFPEDAHASSISSKIILKVVVKVALD